jgi:NAD(P)H-nitrite reductase large subunit
MAILCHCNLVGDRRLARAVDDGAHSLEAVQALTGAGTRCGGCLDAIDEALGRMAGRQRCPNAA